MTRRKPHTVEDRTEKDICVILRSYADGAVSRGVTVPPNIAVKAADEIERLRAALKTCEAWLDRWTQHVGSCQGGHKCTCGRTAVLHEASDALTHEQSAGDNGVRQTNDEVDTDKP